MTNRDSVRVAVFRAANNWPLYVAVEKRLLDQVDVVHISSSKEQLAGLAERRYGIIHTAADNILATYGVSSYGFPEAGRPRIFMGGDGGFLTVYSSRAVGSLGELRGRRVGFDSTKSGFAFVLKKMLSVAGLKEGKYDEVVIGGTDLRYKALLDGTIDAAIMTPPHDLLSSAAGMTRLAEASEHFPRYQGVVGACCPGFPGKSYLRAYKSSLVRALAWLRDRSNKDGAIDILARCLPVDGGKRLLSNLYDSMLSRRDGGFADDGGMDLEGLSNVAMLRREFSPAATAEPFPECIMAL